MAWLAAVGALASAAGTINKGGNDAAALKIQGIVAQQQSQRDEEAQRRETRQFKGQQAASVAEAGLLNEGSTGLLMQQDATLAELDALNIRYKGMLRQYGFNAEAKNTRQQAGMLAGQQLLSGLSGAYTSGMMRGS